MDTSCSPASASATAAALSKRCALVVLASIVAASLLGLLGLGPVDQGAQGHRLADPRQVAGLVNGWSVLLQLPLLAAAALSAYAASRSAIDAALRRVWRLFFALAALSTALSIMDHLAPSAGGYVLSKLPTASACALLSLLFLAERLPGRWLAPRVLQLALASGLLGGLYWLLSARWAGQPDLRPLLWLEHLPMLLVPVGVWSLASRGLPGRDWLVALLWFAVAKLVDWIDQPIVQAAGAAVTGHALHHLPLAACVAWLGWCVWRQGAAAPSAAAAPATQRSTSSMTSG